MAVLFAGTAGAGGGGRTGQEPVAWCVRGWLRACLQRGGV